MPDNAQPPSFSFRIAETSEDLHTISAAVLVQILGNAQRAFELIGVHVEGRGIRERARIPGPTTKRFQLMCHQTRSGSYLLPVEVGAPGDLFSFDLAQRAFQIFQQLMSGIARKDDAALATALPDEPIRRRVLEAVKGMSPRAGADWTLDLRDAEDAVFATFDSGTIPFVERVLVPAAQREAARVVIGELKSIDFTERKVTIIYPPTSRELACIYEEVVEDLLYERRRDLIQVTGRVVVDEQGWPKQIIDVTDIRDVDLSVLLVDTIRIGNGAIKASPLLHFEPALDDSKQLLCIEDPGLGIDVFASTRDLLVAELHEQIAMLWSEYARTADAELDEHAVALKRALLMRFNEVVHAS